MRCVARVCSSASHQSVSYLPYTVRHPAGVSSASRIPIRKMNQKVAYGKRYGRANQLVRTTALRRVTNSRPSRVGPLPPAETIQQPCQHEQLSQAIPHTARLTDLISHIGTAPVGRRAPRHVLEQPRRASRAAARLDVCAPADTARAAAPPPPPCLDCRLYSAHASTARLMRALHRLPPWQPL